MTLRQVSKNFEVSTERIRQILGKATKKIRLMEYKEMLRSGTLPWKEENISGTLRKEENIDVSNVFRYNNDLDCSDWTLSVRSYNALARAGVKTKTDLLRMTDEELLKIRNLGKASLENVKEYKKRILDELERG